MSRSKCLRSAQVLHKPRLVVHADWGSSPAKRRMARAVLGEDGIYAAFAPESVGELHSYLETLLRQAGGGAVVVGFDFPIGVPCAYAANCCIYNFVHVLPQLGANEWAYFYRLAELPQEIAVWRPFYPYRPGNAKQKHLTDRLCVDSIDQLLRHCERARPGRPAASPLFWTLGAKQVGRAAISGWRDVLGPALRSRESDLAIWPFDGALTELIRPGRVVVAETYPAEFYTHFGIQLKSKGLQAERARAALALLEWAAQHGLRVDPKLEVMIRDGFGTANGGDDLFDAVIGLFGMLNVILGLRSEGFPPHRVRMTEGWILGQVE